MQELTIDSVDHWYGSRHVLNNFYLNCKVGEVVGLLGRNGTGKSTLLKVVFGSLKPHHKHLKINGKLIHKGYLTPSLSYLPQGHFIPANLKIKVLVALFVNNHRELLLALPVIKLNLNEQIGNLSGGQRRLIEILLVIYSDSEFVLLDEPFAQISPLLVEEIKVHIEKFKKIKGFLVTDHQYRHIMSISTVLILLHNGSNYTIKNEDELRLHGYLSPS